jgi:hypothetical protein
VSEAAIAALKKRPLHDFAPMLLAGLVSPIQSQWRILWDAAGNVRYQHLFYRDGQLANTLLATDHLAVARDQLAGEEVARRVRPIAGLPASNRFLGVRSAGRDVDRGLQAGVAVAALANAAQREQQVARAKTVIQSANEPG